MATPIAPNAATVTTRAAAEATGGRIVRADGHVGDGADGVRARGITSDSRAVAPGSAFVALAGEKFDGHDFVAMATNRGAALLVVARGRVPGPEITGTADVVEVDDTLVAWGRLARAHVRDWRAHRADAALTAITGSAGKTTTKELCAALFRSRGSCHASAGNLNNRVGVPAVAFGLTPEHRYAVFEAGMSLRGEIAALAEILAPDVAVITNIGVAHAEGVGGTRADVAHEKGALLAALSESGVAIVRREDDAAMAELGRTRAKRIVTFGTTKGAGYRLVDRAADRLDGSVVWIERAGERLQVHLPIPGEAAALDLLAALAATEAVTGAMDAEAITHALRTHLPAIAGRMHVRHAANGTIVLDDSYNANPESVRAALRTLGEVSGARGRRAVVVLGEMRELGPLADDEHAALGSSIAASHATLAVAIGDVAELAIAAAEGIGVTGVRAADAEQAGRVAATLVEPGDVVLVKASRSVGAERVVLALLQAGGGEIDAPAEAR
jgi:UDP-N-acetylmuramoyl-tripeptide--D-alanyl-D-alanine ligase